MSVPQTTRDFQSNGSSMFKSSVNRRNFLQLATSGSLVLLCKFSDGQEVIAQASAVDPQHFAPDLFVSIAPDGTVTCVAHRSEMGTGIRTGLPRVLADELEADWERVSIAQAPGDKRLGDQNTDGSNSIRFFFDRMREAGATARTLLEQAAAKTWGVPASECYADNHTVKHRGSDRSLGFGELVATAKTLDVPTKDQLKLKPRSQWRYIGKDVPIRDLDNIVAGRAIFGIDARMENQLFAVIARPPVVGGKVSSVDETAARAIPGVVDVVKIPGFEGAPNFQPLGGVAVLATSTWAAWQGRDALQIAWDLGPNATYDTDVFAQQLKETVNQPGKTLREVGQAVDVIAKSGKRVSADYAVPHLSHAPMETTCAVANVSTAADGRVTACHILTATQNPQAVQSAVGPALGMNPDDVLCNVTLLGSGFGRKSKPDYCVEAALLSRHAGRPVHVTWTREDDLQHDYYHAIAAIHCEAAVDRDGKPEAWLQRVAFPTIGSTFDARANTPAAWEAEMGHTDLPFDVPNLRLEVGEARSHIRTGWLRAVCHIQQNFAVSSFVDELAAAASRDPLEFWLELLGEDRQLDMQAAGLGNRGADPKDYPYDIGRLKNVLRRAAESANWSRREKMPNGKGLGIAGARSFLGYTGHVIEVDVAKDGTLTVENVWVALDSGTIVSPDRVRSQLEGASIMALTQAKYGKITFKNGRAQQTNYDSYRMVKMADTPRSIHVDIVDSQAAPTIAPTACWATRSTWPRG